MSIQQRVHPQAVQKLRPVLQRHQQCTRLQVTVILLLLLCTWWWFSVRNGSGGEFTKSPPFSRKESVFRGSSWLWSNFTIAQNFLAEIKIEECLTRDTTTALVAQFYSKGSNLVLFYGILYFLIKNICRQYTNFEGRAHQKQKFLSSNSSSSGLGSSQSSRGGGDGEQGAEKSRSKKL